MKGYVRQIGLAICLLVLLPAALSARTWYIMPDGTGDAPTIQAGIDSAVAGDTVLVASGTYYEQDVELKSAICLTSETGRAECVIINASQLGRVLYCEGVDSSTCIEGLTVTRGNADPYPESLGGGIACYLSSPLITHCTFIDNHASNGGGLGAKDSSSPRVMGCTFVNNTANQGGGMICGRNSFPRLANCTFCGNIGSNLGGGVACRKGYPIIEGTIISHSLAGEAIYCNPDDTPVISCTNIYGNAGGDWTGCISGQFGVQGNFSACPSFCNADMGDFHLCDESPCAPGNHPDGYDCGLIGAWDVGCSCGPTATELSTWGSVKALFR